MVEHQLPKLGVEGSSPFARSSFPKEGRRVMIASLMMYRRDELDGAHDRFWGLIRQRFMAAGINAPLKLSQNAEEFSVWTAHDLVLSQTCGMPYRTRLHHQVRLVGTPDYGLDGCPAGYYRSAIIVRLDDKRDDLSVFADARFAFNQTLSQSGFAAPYWHAQSHGFWFQDRVQMDQHVLSARAVADGRADIAALDAVTWRNLQRFDTVARGLRVLDWTKPTPGLPFITAARNDPDIVFEALSHGIRDLDPVDRDMLGLRGIVRIPKQNYLDIPNPPSDAI